MTDNIDTVIYDLSLSDLTRIMDTWDEPPYRAEQLWKGLYQQLWIDPLSFTSFSKHLRTRLSENFHFIILEPTASLRSADQKTVKTVFRLQDGQSIEAVLLRYHRRNTLCISTQAGCAMGCVFCATGKMGFKRHLSSGEIVAQVMYYARQLHERKERVSNIVLMGMGEPFHNYDNCLAAIDRLNDPGGYNFGARRFTISTIGLVPMLRRFTKENRQVNLAVSLHSVDNDVRTRLLPINRKYPVESVLAASRDYVLQTGRRITFEWALIKDVNDTPEHAQQLVAELSGLLCHVNIIPLNPIEEYSGWSTTRERAQLFRDLLVRYGIPCTIRLRRGVDIQAGCGQLIVK